MALRFWLNDRLVVERDVAPTTTLLEYLRQHRHLTGTKEGCAEGDCGACTVAVLDADGPLGPKWRAVDSCLLLLPLLHERRVVTVEGLKQHGGYHPAQEALVQALGSQCGYCTPGVVMSLFEACYRDDLDEDWKIDDQMCGNLCRCTGYRPIRDAAHEVAGLRPADGWAKQKRKARPADRGLDYTSHNQHFVQPATFDELFTAIARHPDHRFVTGATDLGLEVTKRHARFPSLISLGALPELQQIRATDGGWSVGAAVRLSDLEAWAADTQPPLARMLRYFGSRQIKHGATLGGNLCNASPIGDTPPVLLALQATLIARSRQSTRRIPLDAFFTGYRQTALEPGEILAEVEIPRLPAGALAGAYKVSKRRELDISAVAAGMLVRLDDGGRVIEARLGYGGVAATPKRAAHAEAVLTGAPWSEATVERAAAALSEDFTPIDDHRGSAWYRATVAANLLRGFYLETQQDRLPALPARPSGTVLPGGAP